MFCSNAERRENDHQQHHLGIKLSNPIAYNAHLCYDNVYFSAKELRSNLDELPFSTYFQGYDPAVHRVKNVNLVSPFVWAILGGPALAGSRFENLRQINAAKIPHRWSSYLQSCLEGTSLRFEVVASDHRVTTLMGLLPSYGQRVINFMITHELVTISSNAWPYHVANTLKPFTELAIKAVQDITSVHYNRQLLGTLFDLQCLIGHYIQDVPGLDFLARRRRHAESCGIDHVPARHRRRHPQ